MFKIYFVYHFHLAKDASTVKAGFKLVPPLIILNLPLFFWPTQCITKVANSKYTTEELV